MKILFILLLSFLLSVSASENEQISVNLRQSKSRKLLGTGRECENGDIVIAQSLTGPWPNGIPTYRVEITNMCSSGRSISNLHLNCGWFSSSTLIIPKTFKRLKYDDCLVNGGKPIPVGYTISFKYTTSFMYPLSVKSFFS